MFQSFSNDSCTVFWLRKSVLFYSSRDSSLFLRKTSTRPAEMNFLRIEESQAFIWYASREILSSCLIASLLDFSNANSFPCSSRGKLTFPSSFLDSRIFMFTFGVRKNFLFYAQKLPKFLHFSDFVLCIKIFLNKTLYHSLFSRRNITCFTHNLVIILWQTKKKSCQL